MTKLESVPAWATLQKFPIRTAPVWLKVLCSGRGVLYYAQRGKETTLEIIAWNEKSVYQFQDSDRR
jgi:hypothetical protein